MQRRHQAEELLEWKQLLDQEEAEVRRMEKEALAVSNRQKPEDKDGQKAKTPDISPSPSHHQNSEPRTVSEKGEITGILLASVRSEIRNDTGM